jgi:CRISPR system Cascade subunit CasD
VLRASGNAGGTVQSWRYYLSDARFLVGLESGDLEWLHQLDAALRNPIYPLFLGRKSYAPSLPVALPKTGVLPATKLEEALRNQAWRYGRAFEARSTPSLRLRLESSDAQSGSASNDYPLDYARRRFRPRVVCECDPVTPVQIQKDELCISRN